MVEGVENVDGPSAPVCKSQGYANVSSDTDVEEVLHPLRPEPIACIQHLEKELRKHDIEQSTR